MDHRNIIIILADELRRQSLGCYGNGDIRTPHIDALAAEGVRFSNSCSTYPMCVPFRFSFMTGEYAHTRMVATVEWAMSPGETTIADRFNAAGYDTAYIGKWHLNGGYTGTGDARSVNRLPVPRAYQGRWQHWFGFELSNNPFDTCYFVDDDPEPRQLPGYQTDGLFDIAMQYIQSTNATSPPYCMCISVEPPHPPFIAPDALRDEWRQRQITLRPNLARGQDRAKLTDTIRQYCAMVENIDQNVGRLRKFLRTTTPDREPVILFLSDHGALLGSHGRMGKAFPFEESIGIPFIVMEPGASTPSRVIDDPVCTEDIVPTLLGLAGLPPASLPGMDLAPLVRGQAGALGREAVLLELVLEARSDRSFYRSPWRGLRTGRYKYTVRIDPKTSVAQPWQFFDLQEDPYEIRNLVGDPGYRGQVVGLHELLGKTIHESGDRFRLDG